MLDMSQNISIKNKRIAKNTIFLYLRMFIVLLLTLYISRVVLDVLGVVDYGVYNVVGGFVAMFAFLNTSMSNGVQRFYNYDIGESDGKGIPKIYTTSLHIQVLLAVIIFVLTEFLSTWYINNVMVIPADRIIAANWVFQFSLFSFMFVIIQVPYAAAVMAYERMNYYALVSIIDVLLRLLAVISFKYINSLDTLIVYAFVMMLISVINFFLYFIYAKKKFVLISYTKEFDKPLFKRMISFSGWNIFGSFAYMIKDQGLNMLLNGYFGPIVNAARGVSYQVSSTLNGFSTNIFIAFRPQLMQSYSSQDYQRTTSLMFSMSKFTYYLMVLVAFPVMIEIEYILHIWLGKNVPNDTSVFTVLVILNMLITNFNPPVSQVVHATGNMRKYQVITSVILTSILPISWVALHFGAPAISVFWISLLIAIINHGICLMVLKSIYSYSIKVYIKEVVIPCIVVSATVLPIPLFLHTIVSSGILRLILVLATNTIVSLLLIYFVGLSKEEKAFATDVILKKILKN